MKVANTIKNGARIWVRGEGKFCLIGWLAVARMAGLADGSSLALCVQVVVAELYMFSGWAFDVVAVESDRAWARGGGGGSALAWVMNLRCVRENGDSGAKALFWAFCKKPAAIRGYAHA